MAVVGGFRLITRAAPALAVLVALALPGSSVGDLQGDLSSRSATASQLRAAIAAETKRIAATSAGVADAERRLSALQAEATARETELARTRASLVAARNELTRLENRMHDSSRQLAAVLRARYEGDAPDIVTVVLNSHGFSDLLERLNFLERVREQDQTILGDAKASKVRVLAQTERLEGLELRDRKLAAEVIRSRNAAAAVQGALLSRQATQLRERARTSAQLHRVRAQISSLNTRIARLANPVVTGIAGPDLPVDSGGYAQAPAGAPAAVRQVIAAGNAIAGLPYLYGGGHASFHANAYDCSGSVSYALAAAGLVSSPMDSTAFESWGEAGPGRWITVYANAGHAWMVVAGWRFDTVALAEDGTRWTRAMTSTAGFVARHPPGL